jgi:hypothetical protein
VLAIACGTKRTSNVPDLSPLPKALHPILAQMLAPDPAALQSMEEVLSVLDGCRGFACWCVGGFRAQTSS